jgi:hypothetical protein
VREVGIATGYGLDGRGNGVRVPRGARFFSSTCRPDRFWCPPSLWSNGTEDSFSGGFMKISNILESEWRNIDSHKFSKVSLWGEREEIKSDENMDRSFIVPNLCWCWNRLFRLILDDDDDNGYYYYYLGIVSNMPEIEVEYHPLSAICTHLFQHIRMSTLSSCFAVHKLLDAVIWSYLGSSGVSGWLPSGIVGIIAGWNYLILEDPGNKHIWL